MVRDKKDVQPGRKVAKVPEVRVIQPIAEQAKKQRVAAYARVSSDSADQLNSFATQVEYYTSIIQAADEWEFAGLYADEGITGTRADKREDFQRLLQDCRAGKIRPHPRQIHFPVRAEHPGLHPDRSGTEAARRDGGV